MTKIVFVVAGLLLDNQNKILLTERPAGKSLSGLWEFPGGKIEIGEKPAAALVRELKEEIDVDVAMNDCIPLTFVEHDYPDFTLFMPLYVIRRWHGAVRPLENQKFVWVALSDLAQYPVPPADLALIEKLPDLLKHHPA